ncbi:MAG: porin family protein [Hyphomicrobiales bacterium]|nr:porin family protein [Hyphomicrobiales bacterium]MBV8682553.1 porin family protein [Caulobacteraceae bacterium]
MKIRSFCLTSAIAAAAALAAAPALAQDNDVGTWSGPYAGLNLGYGGGNFKYPYSGTTDAAGTNPVSGHFRQDSSGVLGGVTLGYNYETRDGFVAGLETDIDASDLSGKTGFAEFPGTGTSYDGDFSSRINYLGTVRARVGHAMLNNRIVPYVTGGFAYGGVRTASNWNCSACFNGGPGNASFVSPNQMQTGWTVGGGAEYALNRHLSMKVEYLYVNLGDSTLNGTGGTIGGPGFNLYNASVDEKATANVVRVGLNWRF